nr:CDP-glycerol glycerophosphotransferase family protein [Aeromicrobium phoceense]
MLYDASARSVLIGQPQLDVPAPEPQPDPSRSTVLYAPTWEASQPSVSYGSLLTHGSAVVDALAGTHRVIYRPHPLNGVIDPAYGEADAAIRARADRVDTDVPLEQSFADADLLITDVSAVTLNWLPTGKPVLVCRPRVPVPPSRLMDTLPLLDEDADVAALVAQHLSTDPSAAARRDLIEYYLGDTSPGAATERFLQACSGAMDLRDRAWAEHRRLGATGP